MNPSIKKQIEQGSVRAIIVAAGKGSRLKQMTQFLPKCMAIQFDGKTLLETQLETLRHAGISDIVIIRGYAGEQMKCPDVHYVWNHDFAKNNVLESLLCAENKLDGDCIVSYSDIWYEESVVNKLLRSTKDIVIAVDNDWKDYYAARNDHPIEEAEFVVCDSNNRVIKIGKIASAMEVHGEFIGMMKLTSRGCAIFKEHYHRAKERYEGRPYQQAKEFRVAYLTDLLQNMADLGVPIHCVNIGNKWKEIDTPEDFQWVSQWLSQTKNGRTNKE